MNKVGKIKLMALISVLIITIIFVGINFVQAQGKGKPPKKPKCDYDGICEKGESSDCPDCQEQPSPPLQLDHVRSQIVSGSDISDKKAYLISYVDSVYENSWTSNVHDNFVYATSIGDVDNDGYKEIITVVSAKKMTGPPSQRYSHKKIFVYEDGSKGDPSYTSYDLGYLKRAIWDSTIADADNNGFNEVILAAGDHIEIYEWNGSDFSHLWTGPAYDVTVWSVDVGDANNDGINEVVAAISHFGSAIIYEHLGNNSWGNSVTTESIGVFNIDQAKVRDADNDGINEIIGGGTSNRLNIWKYSHSDGAYVNVFLSEDLGGFTQGVDAGDIDGDTYNEVVVGTSGMGGNGMVYVFEYDSSMDTYVIRDSISCSGVGTLSVGDIDHDGKDEIVVGTVHGITVFDFDNGRLKYTYSFPYGGYVEIG